MTIRSNAMKIALAALLAGGLATLLVWMLAPSKATTAPSAFGPMMRIAAQFNMFDGGEFSTSNEPSANAGDGQAIYDTVVYPPGNANVLYVTVSGTGDAHANCDAPTGGPSKQQPCGQSKILLACLTDGHPCNSGGSGENGAPSGWVTLLYPDGDLHDNGIAYQWCATIKPSTAARHVTVKMASDNGGWVNMEQTHFFVDASQLPHGCTEAATPEGAGGGPPVSPKQP